MFRCALVALSCASFALGCVLELLGFAGAGLVSTVPGGLFELFFAVWLIAKGFNLVAITAPIAPVALRTFASQS